MHIRCLSLVLVLLLASCGGDRRSKGEANEQAAINVDVPRFNSDSAFAFVATQVGFGPRIPNTPAHLRAAEFFVATFKRYGADITIQEFQSEHFSGSKLNLKNIIASFNPQATKRILLAAHWDTRPFSDKDPEKPDARFPGANDGGSGVGVLLEIARVLSSSKAPNVGVDMILFDGEDWGEREGEQGLNPPAEGLQDWWCLGSQH